jgi:hypothetical protein
LRKEKKERNSRKGGRALYQRGKGRKRVQGKGRKDIYKRNKDILDQTA